MRISEISSVGLGFPKSELVERSWDRSRKSGISTSDTLMFNEVSTALQNRVRERNRRLVSAAMPEMTLLRNSLANTPWMVACVGDDGVVVDALSNPAIASKRLRLALRTGITLSEDVVGTNGPGCALVERRPVIVGANDHYLQEAKGFVCVAVPLIDPKGRLLGALDASYDDRDTPGNTPVSVVESLVLAGRAVQNRLVYDLERAIFVRFHHRSELLGSPLEGILAFSDDGYLLGLNQSARDILDIEFDDTAQIFFESLFDISFHSALDRARAVQHEPGWLDGVNGMRLLAQIGSRGDIAHKTVPGARVAQAERRHATDVVADDALLRQMLERARCVFARDIPVLINGETGTGKEVVARMLHSGGPRANGPFVAINCASIPATLIESELFGYADGAFTGGRRGGAAGKLEAANRGTLFLDEIGDMPIELQARLLRVLQERSFSRIGSARPIHIDISVICATHRDLRREIEKGAFREDLFYRINGLRIKIPPLRERSDIKALIEQNLAEAAAGHAVLRISEVAMHALLCYSWPGNIRELQHVLRLATALTEEQGCIELEHLPEEIGGWTGPSRAGEGKTEEQAMPQLRQVEMNVVRASLHANNGNISLTARSLGISRQTLYRKLEEFQLRKV